jgi:hypothetical protein
MALFSVIFISQTAFSSQTIVASKVVSDPVLDGSPDDAVWKSAAKYTIKDNRSGDNITLKAIYTKDKVSFLVTYPDSSANIQHKPLVWDKETMIYKPGPQREDGFAFKWNMEDTDVNLSNFSDDNYIADIWYWKAARTNPAGYADDKMHNLASITGKKAAELTSKKGKKRYLMRLSDKGKSASKKRILAEYQGDIVDQYVSQTPEGSRADVAAKGVWKDGHWTIELSRRLDTGNEDDIKFSTDSGKRYKFGVSIFGLYGNPEDSSKPHLYGQGRISEELYLVFK